MDSSMKRGASNPERFSELVSVARKIAEQARPDSMVGLYRKIEAGRIDPEIVDQRLQKADSIVGGFMNTLMDGDWWRYRQLVALIAWASLPNASRESLVSHARSFVPVEPPSVYEFVKFVPIAASRAKRLGVDLDELFPAQSDCEAPEA